MAAECCPALESAGVEQSPVIAGELERVAGFFQDGRILLVGADGTLAREQDSDDPSMQSREMPGFTFNEA
jgi:hypothetical protein